MGHASACCTDLCVCGSNPQTSAGSEWLVPEDARGSATGHAPIRGGQEVSS